jgi:hypothetical protein
MTARLDWMQKKVQQCFDLSVETVATFFFQNNPKIMQFLTNMETPPHLFIFYQKRQAPEPELFIPGLQSLSLVCCAFATVLFLNRVRRHPHVYDHVFVR